MLELIANIARVPEFDGHKAVFRFEEPTARSTKASPEIRWV